MTIISPSKYHHRHHQSTTTTITSVLTLLQWFPEFFPFNNHPLPRDPCQAIQTASVMCGIIALLLADKSSHVSQLIFDGLTSLQHRGQGLYHICYYHPFLPCSTILCLLSGVCGARPYKQPMYS